MNQLQKQLAIVDRFMLSEMKCGASLSKLEKWEKEWDAWKAANGFHRSDDCATVSATIKMRMEGELV